MHQIRVLLLLVLIGSFTTMLWADDPVSSVEEDRKAIAELIDRYVQGVNEKDINRTMSVFAATYSDDNYDNWAPWPLYEPFRSKAALRKGFERIMRWDVFFEVSAPKLEFLGDRAVGHVWVRECHLRNRSFVGRKRIELVKEDDAWKISRWEWDRLDDPEQRANARAQTAEGRALLGSDDARGLDTLRNVVDEFPHYSANAQLAIADHFFFQLDFEAALREYQGVLKIWGTGTFMGETPAQLAKTQIACIEHFLPNRSPLETLARAKTLESEGKRAKAAETYRALATAHPDAPHAPAWLLKVNELNGRDLDLLAELIDRYPNSWEAIQSLPYFKARPQVAVRLASKYPQAPWATFVKEGARQLASSKMVKAELPALRKATNRYLGSLGALDDVAALDAVSEQYLGMPRGVNGSPETYLDLKVRGQLGPGLGNTRTSIVKAREEYTVHPDGKHAMTSILGKRVQEIFKNGYGYLADRHDYLSIALTLTKQAGGWKVSSAILQEVDFPKELKKMADQKELTLLRQWEQDADHLELRERKASILLGIADRFRALDITKDADRIRQRVKEEYADTEAATRILQHKDGEHFVIHYNVPEEYADAILGLCEAAYDGYREIYGIDLLEGYPDPRIRVTAIFGDKLALWVAPDSNPDINLVTPDVERLGPPRAAGGQGAHYVYGFAHEMGHIAIGFEEKTAWTQGIAHYVGTQVLPHIEKVLGTRAWAVPYDYVQIEGPARMMKGIEHAQPGTEDAVCKVLYEVERRHGPKTIGQAVRKTKELGHASTRWGLKYYAVGDFKTALMDVTGDPTIEKLFHECGL